MTEVLRKAGMGDIIVLGEYESYSFDSNLSISKNEKNEISIFLRYKGNMMYEYSIYGIYAGMSKEALENKIKERSIEVLSEELIEDYEDGQALYRNTYRVEDNVLVVYVDYAVDSVLVRCLLSE